MCLEFWAYPLGVSEEKSEAKWTVQPGLQGTLRDNRWGSRKTTESQKFVLF